MVHTALTLAVMNLGVLNRFSLVFDFWKAKGNQTLVCFGVFFQMSKDNFGELINYLNIILHSFCAASFLPYSTFDIVGRE